MPPITKEQYTAAERRIDQLLQQVTDATPTNDPRLAELIELSDLVERYEQLHYPITTSAHTPD